MIYNTTRDEQSDTNRRAHHGRSEVGAVAEASEQRDDKTDDTTATRRQTCHARLNGTDRFRMLARNIRHCADKGQGLAVSLLRIFVLVS
jgi:hypothetical protein